MTFHSAKERIVGGIAQEMVERLMRKGASPGHLADSSDYVATITPFDPEVHKALLFEMMQESGVSLLLHAYFLSAQLDGDAVCGATFATVGGVRAAIAEGSSSTRPPMRWWRLPPASRRNKATSAVASSRQR